MAAVVLAAARLLRGSRAWGRSRLRWAGGRPGRSGGLPGLVRGPRWPASLGTRGLWSPDAQTRRRAGGLGWRGPGLVPGAPPCPALRTRTPSPVRRSVPAAGSAPALRSRSAGRAQVAWCPPAPSCRARPADTWLPRPARPFRVRRPGCRRLACVEPAAIAAETDFGGRAGSRSEEMWPPRWLRGGGSCRSCGRA